MARFVSCDAILVSMLTDLFDTIESSSSSTKDKTAAASDVSFFIGKCTGYMKQKGVLPIIQGRDTRRGSEGYTLLHTVARVGNIELMKYIINHGADINAVDNSLNLYTPLMLAVENSSYETATLLAANGANLSCVNVNGENIFHYFARANNATYLKQVVAASNIDTYTIQQLASKQSILKKKQYPENYAPVNSIVSQVCRSYREQGVYYSANDLKSLKRSQGHSGKKKTLKRNDAGMTSATALDEDSLAAFAPQGDASTEAKLSP